MAMTFVAAWAATFVESSQREALIAFYDASQGSAWVNSSGWLNGGSVCTWYGLECTDGAVTKISLSSNNLDGELPSALGELNLLQSFDVSNNSLRGILPSTLANWTRLQEFYADNNELSGPLLPELAAWADLLTFAVYRNGFNGTLPAAYASSRRCCPQHDAFVMIIYYSQANWTKIRLLHAYSNDLKGSLPSFYMMYAGFTGTLPKEWKSWTNIVEFCVHGNNLGGSLPPEFSDWTNIEYFKAGENAFSGPLPVEYSRWSRIKFFGVYASEINGTVPEAYSNWTDLEYFYVCGRVLQCRCARVSA
ncbi:hypothetical protein CTAYLR_005606 [Chrysophaeum taylorii]|uniref:Leucine-rich repeat-containing N-terminal plant-type domain-containing protein n=1 Tax=Chrysophaeum taylorii TaxID=2483200 RepID=A0AAD7XIQ6_9STRA|nr:hypothetical protein CTAYLR_005606 [Chrysophaeum taylorii]